MIQKTSRLNPAANLGITTLLRTLMCEKVQGIWQEDSGVVNLKMSDYEYFWAWLKNRLQRVLSEFARLDDAIMDCFQVC